MKYLRHISQVRQLREADRSAILAHFLALGAEDRYRRFLRPMSDAAIESWLARFRFEQELLFGIYGPGGDAGIRGILLVSPAIDGRWELSFSVVPGAQRQGIGEALGRRAIEYLPVLGAKEAWLCCMSDNTGMRALAAKLGFSLQTESGETWARLPIPALAKLA
jgi:RimJ/RimL family protein N-acetyltransferase